MAPLILDKEKDGDDADDHRAGYADDNHQPAVHLDTDLSAIRPVVVFCVFHEQVVQ